MAGNKSGPHGRMAKRELPGSVYRCKGIVFTGEDPAQPFALQVVGRRTSLTPLTGRRDEAATSEIVAIGRDIDGGELEELFASCLATPSVPVAAPT
jgi:G3E family GTPase